MDYQDLLDHLDEMDWMELMDRKGTRERGDPGVLGPPGPPGLVSGGATYTRWERTQCPNKTGTSLVYNGRAAMSFYNHTGGGVNYQCLPNNPEYGGYAPGVQESSPMNFIPANLFLHPFKNTMSHVLSAMSPPGQLY